MPRSRLLTRLPLHNPTLADPTLQSSLKEVLENMEQTRTVWHMQARACVAPKRHAVQAGRPAGAERTSSHDRPAVPAWTCCLVQLDHQRNRVLRINLLIRCGNSV